ncbi:MAG: hypothetical protein V1908_03905 [Candidatus Peregrinibacteria bacterium]
MKTIIIGAGRGRRLEYLTDTEPKTFTEIKGKRILDWILQAHLVNDFKDIIFIGGYLIDVIRQEYPRFTFRHNEAWETNNILQSLFFAADDMDDGFICSYSDILYTQEVVKKLLAASGDIVVAIDTDWKSRYRHRSKHPSSDAEKVLVEGGIVTRFHRDISETEAFGEFIGVAKFSPYGALIFKQEYEKLNSLFHFEDKIPLNKAYLIHFLNHLAEKGVKINYVTTHGNYIEIDTLEDLAYANKHWLPASLLFPAGVVGSLPRPQFVQDIILKDGNPFSPLMDKAVLYAIALQEQAGLDIISDGEWRRKSYVGVIGNIVDGLEHFFNPEDGRSWHTVTQKLRYDRPGFFAREAAFLKKHTSRKIKVCLPSPYLLGERLWNLERSSNAYETREAFVADLIPILRNEILLLRDAGADIAQIDDPHICLFVDRELRQQYANPEQELAYACSVVNEVTKGIDGIEIALHLCRRNKGRQGWIGKGGYDSIIPLISTIDVDQFVLEYSIPVAGDFSALKGLPKKAVVGLGCVDCRFEHIDTPEEIVARVEKALRYIAPERIILNPDCGFAPGSQAEVPLDEAYQKLKNEVEAAHLLRRKYS